MSETPPDISVSIPCPLCEYDMRGLPEPRCPECGARFTWKELLEDRPHPYLFEHHPERNVVAFLRTALGGLRPLKFWKTLRPTHRIVARRLTWYWAIVCVLMASSVLGIYGLHCVQLADQIARARASYPAVFGDASYRQLLDEIAPQPGSMAFFRRAWLSPRDTTTSILGLDPRIENACICCVILLLWPWLTLASLATLRITLRRANVRRAQLSRVVIYCGDAFLWMPLAALVILAVWVWNVFDVRVATTGRRWAALYPNELEEWFVGSFAALLVLVFAIRFGVALRRYLQLRHAVSTAILLQIIVLLTYAAIVSQFG